MTSPTPSAEFVSIALGRIFRVDKAGVAIGLDPLEEARVMNIVWSLTDWASVNDVIAKLNYKRGEKPLAYTTVKTFYRISSINAISKSVPPEKPTNSKRYEAAMNSSDPLSTRWLGHCFGRDATRCSHTSQANWQQTTTAARQEPPEDHHASPHS